MAGYGGGYGAWANRGNEEVKKQTQEREKTRPRTNAPAPPSTTRASSGWGGGWSAPVTGPTGTTQAPNAPEVRQQEQTRLKDQAHWAQVREENKGKPVELPSWLQNSSGNPLGADNNSYGSSDIRSLFMQKADAGPDLKSKRYSNKFRRQVLSREEYNALSPERKRAVKFNTEFLDARKRGDKAAIEKLYKDLSLDNITLDNFRRGEGLLTMKEMELKPPKMEPGSREMQPAFFPKPQWADNTGPLVGQTDRDRLLSQISTSIDEMFAKRKTEGKSLDQTFAKSSGLPEDVVHLGRTLNYTGEQTSMLEKVFREASSKSMWQQPGNTPESFTKYLGRLNIPVDAFIDYAGRRSGQLHKAKQPLSGNANDTLTADELRAQLGIKRRD